MLPRAAALAIALLLAACQVENGPPLAAGPGPGIYREARQVCRGEAARRDFRLERFLGERDIRGPGGRLRAVEVEMRLRRQGRVQDRLCEFDVRSGTARLLGSGQGVGLGGRPMEVARRACRRAAEREGFGFRRFLSERQVTGSRGRVIGAEIGMRIDRRGRREDILCDYTYDTDRARLRGLDGGAGGRPGDEMRRAERACTRLAENRGLEVRAILSRESYLHADGRLRGAEIVMRVARGNRVYPVTCTYTGRTGTAQF